MSSALSALLSPRFFRRTQQVMNDGVVKSGKIYFIDECGKVRNSMYAKVTKEGNRHSVQFYTDPKLTFSYGTINMNKCSLRHSLPDLRIELYTNPIEGKECPGMVLEATSATDKQEWVDALTPTGVDGRNFTYENTCVSDFGGEQM